MRKVKLRIKESFAYGRVEFTSQYRHFGVWYDFDDRPVLGFYHLLRTLAAARLSTSRNSSHEPRSRGRCMEEVKFFREMYYSVEHNYTKYEYVE